jgi:hypothetical protein
VAADLLVEAREARELIAQTEEKRVAMQAQRQIDHALSSPA